MADNGAAQPPMPSLSVKQFLPLIVMFALNKVDIEKDGWLPLTRVMYCAVQVAALIVIFLIQRGIAAMPRDDDVVVECPETKTFGQVTEPAKTVAVHQYDDLKWKEMLKQFLISAMIMALFHLKWGYIQPLVLQCVLVPSQMSDNPLFHIHIRGKEAKGAYKRPFPAPNPLGLPTAPPAAAEPEKTPQEAKREAKKLAKKDTKKTV